MPKILATAISIAATREEIKSINLVATLRGVNTAELVREAVFAYCGEEIQESGDLLANRESRKKHSPRTVRND